MEIMEASGKVEGGSLGDRQFKAVTASMISITSDLEIQIKLNKITLHLIK